MNKENDNEVPGKIFNEQDQEKVTDGVSLLNGDPKKAILKLSGPLIVAFVISTSYNMINAAWVSGLGSDALAAVGIISPICMIVSALSWGLGAGVSSSISRRIGARDKSGADNTAMHAMLLTIIVSVILTLVLLCFLEPMLVFIGAGTALGPALEYGYVFFAGTIFTVFTQVAFSILRGEGDTKRTMYAMAAGSLINIILDPILIYWAGLGIAGAAWGTIISLFLVSAVQIYWLLIKKDTYVSLSWKAFAPSTNLTKDIFIVGFPISLENILMSIDGMIINSILILMSGTDAVAVYTACLRVLMVAIIPLTAIASASVPVFGAAIGSRRYGNLSIILNYSIKFSILIGAATSIITAAFAPQITMLFTYSSESARLAPTMIACMQVMSFFYPFAALALISSGLFQGAGKGLTSLYLFILRDIVCILTLVYVLGVVLGLGQQGVWWGVVLGNIIGGIFSFLWARLYISRVGS
jgi:putative MATE family efflux protein